MLKLLTCTLVCVCLTVRTYAKDINSELHDAVKHLTTINYADQPYLYYFTTYAIPEREILIKGQEGSEDTTTNLRAATPNILSFWIHSMSRENVYRFPVKVTDTLYYIDIRDYGWEKEDVELVANLDPYVREPWINHKEYNYARLVSGNILFRADWFINHTSDLAYQIDRKIKDLPYYILTYGRNKIPKNLKEFQDFWGVDIKKIQRLELHAGDLVDIDDTGVSRHARYLERARTEIGYYYKTLDVGNMIAEQDFAENIFPKKYDAGETFITNRLGLQVYLLFDGNDNRVDLANNQFVIDKTDAEDVRVRTAKSCIICHNRGVNIPISLLRKYFEAGTVIKVFNDDYKNAVEGFYKNIYKDSKEGKTQLELDMQDDMLIFNRGCVRASKYDSSTIVELYQRLYDWYKERITRDQACLEFGLEWDALKDKGKGVTGARASGLFGINKEVSVPRYTWEEEQGGTYAQLQLLLNRINPQVYNTKPVVQQEREETYVESKTHYILITSSEAVIQRYDDVRAVKKGQKLSLYGIVKHPETGVIFYRILCKDGRPFFVRKEFCQLVRK